MYSFFWTEGVSELLSDHFPFGTEMNTLIQNCFPLCNTSFMESMRALHMTFYGDNLSTIIAFENQIPEPIGMIQLVWNDSNKTFKLINFCFMRSPFKKRRGVGKTIIDIALKVATEMHPEATSVFYYVRLLNTKLQSSLEKMGWKFTRCVTDGPNNTVHNLDDKNIIANGVFVEYEWSFPTIIFE